MLLRVSFFTLQCCTSCFHSQTGKVLRWLNLNYVFWVEEYSLNFTLWWKFPKVDNNSLMLISSPWSATLICGIMWDSEPLWIPTIHFCSMPCLQGSSVVSVMIIFRLSWALEHYHWTFVEWNRECNSFFLDTQCSDWKDNKRSSCILFISNIFNVFCNLPQKPK